MDRQAIIKGIEAKQIKTNIPDIRVGETVRVHYKIREGNKERIQVFEGLVIAVQKGTTLQGSFTVRKVVSGVGVERTFPIHSPHIAKIERLKSGKIRRAKLYFVRRHAQSPKRFRLKDKGVAGTVWEEVAKQQEEIQNQEAVIEAAEVAPAEEPAAEPVASEAQSEDNLDNDKSAVDAGDAGGADGRPAADEEGPSTPSPEPQE